MDRVPFALRHRSLLLPARNPRRAREGRRRGADRLVPPQPPRPCPRGRLARRAQRYGRRLGRQPTMPGGSGPAPARSGNTSPSSSRCSRRFPTSRSRPAAGSPRASTATARSRSARTATRCPSGWSAVKSGCSLHASHLVVFDGRTEVARHERLIAKGATRLDLDHYLEVLLRKPGALPGATALEQARAPGRFTPVHDAWWAAARKAHGDARRHPRPDRGPAAAPAHAPRPRRRRPGRPRCGPARSPRTPSRWKPASPPQPMTEPDTPADHQPDQPATRRRRDGRRRR